MSDIVPMIDTTESWLTRKQVEPDCATLASRRRATTLPGPVFHRQERVSFA